MKKAPDAKGRRGRKDRWQRHALALQPGESVILVARPSLIASWPKYLGTLGLYGIWRKRHTTVLTNRRILVNKGLFTHSERAIPINHINDASFLRRGLFAYADLMLRGSRGVERIGPLTPREARQLTSEVVARDEMSHE